MESFRHSYDRIILFVFKRKKAIIFYTAITKRNYFLLMRNEDSLIYRLVVYRLILDWV